MKNTTFRKKALLSSVAMLLVAIVALGSATFAWFTANPTVSASGLVMNASTDAGLQILADKHKTELAKTADGVVWGTSTIINAKTDATSGEIVADTDPIQIGDPASFAEDKKDAITFMKATALNETAPDADTTTIGSGAAAYTENLYLKSSINSTIQVKSAAVKINFSEAGGTISEAIRVMLVDTANNNNVLGIWSEDGTANSYIKSDKSIASAYTKAQGNGATITLDEDNQIDVNFNGDTTIAMYVWLDGEDSTCFTQNVQNLEEIVSSIQVKFSLNTGNIVF